MAIFIEARPERVDEFGTLVDEPLSGAKQNGSAFLFSRLWLDEAHFRPLGRDHDSLGLCRVFLLPLHKWLHVMRRNQLHLMTEADHLTGTQFEPPLFEFCDKFLAAHAPAQLSPLCPME